MQIQAYRYGMRHEVLNDLLGTLRCLRVLNLSEYDIKLLPDSINNLIHLRHLNMSSTSILVLPESICTLYNLQELLLANCKSLAVLPINLGRLIKLTHLDLEGTNLRKMPAQMGNLKDLKILDKFVLHIEHDVLELKKLQNLRGTLCIGSQTCIGFIVYGTDGSALEANILKDKKFLTEVVMNWVYLPDESGKGEPSLDRRLSRYTQLERELLHKLQPHTNLEVLTIKYYRGTTFPDWPNFYSSSALVYLRLFKCKNCITLPPLGQLPSLRELHIEGLNGVKSIGPEFYGDSGIKPFRSLLLLLVDRMLGLEEWSYIGDVNHELELFPQLEIVSFPDGRLHAPNLTELDIHSCQRLRSMPKHMNTLLPCLQQLWISNCQELESFPEGRLPSKLQLLEITSRKLIANHKHWGLDRLTCLAHLSLVCQEYEEHVELFPEEGVYLPNTLTFLRICNFLNLKTINQNGTWAPELSSNLGDDELSCSPMLARGIWAPQLSSNLED
uniref:putative disease resistance RPP13-like protein 1 n=1 Tax=Fragaria vesca subsp. vesca TaxID=101020 RepID=UPI0005C90138|nr:PREDICTED: putative disease resistance RPP13-like protein 1 [Fragaria vesca subsp. vesca]